ncbi:FAD-dependent thymidylate synthase [uncultured Microscilla sp.]|uniref:FAD-dependent thymidylate synthase n=1 Tax=uncultured Microscilla sp. TaxID=432653 RepID=UPI00262CB818|nr:FAD-dependent thymidylate synthase [uncultured Microscilla sp.]
MDKKLWKGTRYQQMHKQMIVAANGIVDDIFVLKTGVLITKKSRVTAEAKQLFDQMNIDTTRPVYEQHAEFNSRLTYLSFKDQQESAAAYNQRLIQEYGHRSVYNDEHVTFLIAGCALETSLEFVAHNEATIARLTSSKTNAQNNPFFKLLGYPHQPEYLEKQKQVVAQYLEQKDKANELTNILAPGNKATSFTISMSIKDWHKTLIGRLSLHGVETDMRQVMEEVARQLKVNYPLFFNTIEEYYALGNNKKYEE